MRKKAGVDGVGFGENRKKDGLVAAEDGDAAVEQSVYIEVDPPDDYTGKCDQVTKHPEEHHSYAWDKEEPSGRVHEVEAKRAPAIAKGFQVRGGVRPVRLCEG